jgi:hypothetical protein
LLLQGAFFVGGGGRGMKQRYTFQNGQVTVQTGLYDLLTGTSRERGEAVVLLIIQHEEQPQEGEDEKTD